MTIVQEFRAFIARGNVMDLAIAVIVGGAFNAIVTSVVSDLFMPLLSLITRGTDFSSMMISLGSGEDAAHLTYGNFIGAVIHFLTVSVVVFFALKAYNRFTGKKSEEAAEEAPPTKACPYCASNIPEAAVRCPSCTTVLDEAAVPEALR